MYTSAGYSIEFIVMVLAEIIVLGGFVFTTLKSKKSKAPFVKSMRVLLGIASVVILALIILLGLNTPSC